MDKNMTSIIVLVVVLGGAFAVYEATKPVPAPIVAPAPAPAPAAAANPLGSVVSGLISLL